VSKDNLGVPAGLVAGAALLIDYVLTVAVSVAAGVVTIVLPEFIPSRWWQLGLHNQTAFLIKGAMLFRKNVIVTDVPYHLRH
jgi:hypothetical protein